MDAEVLATQCPVHAQYKKSSQECQRIIVFSGLLMIDKHIHKNLIADTCCCRGEVGLGWVLSLLV